MHIEEIEGIDLDYLVADEIGLLLAISGTKEFQLANFRPSIKPDQASELSSRFGIVVQGNDGEWAAWSRNYLTRVSGSTPYIAIARSFVAMKLGLDVEIKPDMKK